MLRIYTAKVKTKQTSKTKGVGENLLEVMDTFIALNVMMA